MNTTRPMSSVSCRLHFLLFRYLPTWGSKLMERNMGISAQEVHYFNGIMPWQEWHHIELAARYAYNEDERMAAIYRRSAGYSQADMDRDPR